jgi:hypothetical protein
MTEPTHLRRPETFVPLSVRFITGRTGTKLLEKFGRDGPLVWAAYLAACKLSRPEGEIVYASEAEGWALLGLSEHEPDFTLDAFFTFTGRMKKTRRTRSGRVSYVVCTAWGRWTKTQKQEAERKRKSRNRAQSERDTSGTHTGTKNGQQRDLELEIEGEQEEQDQEQEPSVLPSELQHEEDGRTEDINFGKDENPSTLQRRLKAELDRRSGAFL